MITASLGRVSPRHKGEYNSSNIYTKLDIVSYLGSSYMVLKDTVGVTPVVGANYQLVAEAGTSTAITNLTVSTGAPGTAATVTPGGTALQRTYALTVPRGDKGVDGSFAQKAYTTEALMIADKAEIPTNTSVMVTNDTAPSKNGLYAYNGTTFTKSGYDPLAQAKNYADENKLDYKEISYDYLGGSIIAPDTKVVVGKGYYSGYAYISGSESESTILPVSEGEVLYIFNDKNIYDVYDGAGNAFTATDPDLGASPPITDNRVFMVDGASSVRYMKVTVPVGANFFVFNSKFRTPTKWSVQRNKFKNTYEVGEKVLFEIKGAKIPEQIDRNVANELVLGNDVSGDLYNPSGKLPKTYLGSDGAQDGNAYWSAYRFAVKAGATYYIKITQPLSFPHMMVYTNSLSGSTGVTRVGFITPQATTTDNLYTFTVPTGQGIVAVFMNLNISTDPAYPSYTYNVENTLSIQEGIYKEGALSKTAISSINGNTLIDSDLRAQFIGLQSQAVTAKTRLTGKKVFALGDSMTAGYNGGYLKYLEAAFGASVINYGENAARSTRMVDILTAGSGIPLRNSVGANTMPAKDITNVACVTLMIGTNDSDGAISSLAEMANLPSDTDNVYGYPDPLNYFAKFTNSYIGNIALCIEYIQWKSPTAEIHIIAPPHLYNGASGRARILQLQEPLKAICEKYSVHFINGTVESGISYKLMNPALGIFSTDSTHLTVAGNKLFGEYVAAKVLSYG